MTDLWHLQILDSTMITEEFAG